MLTRHRWQVIKWHLKRGEVPPVWRLLPDSVSPSERPDPPKLEPVDSASVPSWIQHDLQVKQVKNTGSPAEEYYTALAPTDDSTTIQLRLSPSQQSTGIGFDLLNTNHAEKVTVLAEREQSGGASEEIARATLSNHPDFCQANSVPVELEFEKPARELTLSVSFDGFDSPSLSPPLAGKPAISLPGMHGDSNSNPPIFLITVDTFRYDTLDHFTPVIDALGPTAVIPDEPRTQGHWTRPSHATMLSGTHPGTHGYVAGAQSSEYISKVPESVPFFPEQLAEAGYRCSACVSQGTIDASYGFGRGFQSFGYRPRDWKRRQEDAATTLARSRQWLRRIVTEYGCSDVFYFLHLFDPHYPYIPPEVLGSVDEVDIPEIIEFKKTRKGMDDWVTEARRGGESFDQDALDRIRQYYDNSVEYTANELALFIDYLKRIGLFDDALIIVSGDHGEEFFERGFAQHTTLRDRNIRPGMIIKPPKTAEMSIPDRADTIDFPPTICDIAGVDTPSDFAGDSWISNDVEYLEERVRLTELVSPEWYQVAAQIGEIKGIFCWPSSFPERPGADTLSEPPEYSEFYNPETARANPDSAWVEPDSKKKEQFLQAARQFSHMKESERDDESTGITDEAEERLEDLGYK